ncbi:MAG TPA: diaminopimelate decarboxylase [Coriobacteriia bacterium]
MGKPSAPRLPATPDQKTTADLAAVLPMTFEVKDGHLWIGGVDMVTLARETGTALYVMDEATIRHQLSEYVKWTQFHWKDVDVVYAGKAFMSVAMIKLVEEEGCCLLCASGGELAYAKRAGFPMSRVQVHGNNKTPSELIDCVEAGVSRVVVDNFDELTRLSAIASERGIRQPVLIRVTPGVEADTHDFIMTGAEDSKFGFGLNQGLAMEAVKRAVALPGIDFEGLHMHIGSQIFALHSFATAIEVIVAFMRDIQVETGVPVRMLDVGGGLGVAYGVPDEPSTIKEFGKVVVDGIKEECQRHGLAVPRMAVEPGRSIVANAGVTLYTVGTVKEIPGIRTYVAVDGGMSDNIRTALYDAHYEALIANKADRPREMVASVAGKHCESGDIVVRDASLQSPEVDDILCVCATGAYCQSMSSNYNKNVRPGVVFVRDGEWRFVIRRENYDDLMKCELD